MSGGKRKCHDDYEYVVIYRDYRHVPHLTTLDGVRGVMSTNGLSGAVLEDHVRAVMQGGVYTPNKGIIISVHRKKQDVRDKLREVAITIHHTGKYGSMWWNKHIFTAWWTYCEDDLVMPNCTPVEHIRRAINTVKEVRHVRVECEAMPDTRRDRRWVEIYPK